MSEEPASKRRRFESAPMNQRQSAPLPGIASIDSLPDTVLQHCFSFLGPNHYRYVAGTSRRFKEIYSIKHQRETRWEIAAASVACAQLSLKDIENGGEDENDCLKMIVLEGAMKIGNVKVLEWARNKGFDYESKDFNFTTFRGHFSVLKWAEEKNLEWYGEDTLVAVASGGHFHIFEWIRDSGRDLLGVELAARAAALCGEVPMLSWTKERNLLDENPEPSLYKFASTGGHIDVLNWLRDNDYTVCRDSMLDGAASGDNFIESLIWARQHGITFDEETCAYAAFFGNLPMLQWLRGNGCPWDAGVVHAAVDEGQNHVLVWAIANGCPIQ